MLRPLSFGYFEIFFTEAGLLKLRNVCFFSVRNHFLLNLSQNLQTLELNSIPRPLSETVINWENSTSVLNRFVFSKKTISFLNLFSSFEEWRKTQFDRCAVTILYEKKRKNKIFSLPFLLAIYFGFQSFHDFYSCFFLFFFSPFIFLKMLFHSFFFILIHENIQVNFFSSVYNNGDKHLMGKG